MRIRIYKHFSCEEFFTAGKSTVDQPSVIDRPSKLFSLENHVLRTTTIIFTFIFFVNLIKLNIPLPDSSYNLVPIVYGGANYSVFAPPGSYIDALDYDSPKELVDHLKTLMQNPREYAKYFRWKKYYKINKSSRRAACNLCEFLHKRSAAEPRRYFSLSDWYSRDKCPLQSYLNNEKYATGAILKESRLNT